MAVRTTKLFLDRIEGDFGVVLSPDGSAMDIPLTMLPDGVRDGVALVLTFAVDENETLEAAQRVADMLAELKRGDGE